jgi:transmembrane sensor
MHREDLETQATQWLVRLDRDPSPELVAEHEAWLARSIRHKIAFTRQQIAWKRMDVLRRARPLDHVGEAVDPDLLKPRTPWFGLSAVLAAFAGAGWAPRTAAVLASTVMVAIVAAMVLWPRGDIEYVTRVGQLQNVTLDDGTQLTLNTNSKVRVRFSAQHRRIFLDRGEVVLAVAHDTSRPLEVIAGDVTSRAIGTKFSVRIHEDEEDTARVEALVTEGRVLVLRQPHVLGLPLGRQAVTETLDAGEKVVIGRRGAEVSHVTARQAERQLMWMTGQIVLDGESLADVVREVNRYNERKLVILDPKIARVAVGGTFRTSEADAYARHLIEYYGAKRLNTETPPQ